MDRHSLIFPRMSFNNNGWEYPSGFEGKTESSGSHEYEFGSEGWFFNSRRFIGLDGRVDCHFAYLDPVRYFDVESKLHDDLIRYTLKHTSRGIEWYVVAELQKDEGDLLILKSIAHYY